MNDEYVKIVVKKYFEDNNPYSINVLINLIDRELSNSNTESDYYRDLENLSKKLIGLV